ncbi:MAG: hypothetical protein ACRD44_14340 [Bryobacteraceae bacterium]
MYVKGARESKCSFAYLEHPRLGGDNGRLVIHARFHGKSARSFFGKCLGWGDNFDVTITGTPQYADGIVTLSNVVVTTPDGRETLYIRRVRKALAESLGRDFKYRLKDDAQRMLTEMKIPEPFQQQMLGFHVAGIAVTEAAVVLTLEFQLAVK